METLRILWLNWRDISNPAAGGAELYTDQIAIRLARKGHEVTLLTSRHHGSKEREVKENVSIVRRGNSASVYWEVPRFIRAQAREGIRYDVVVDAINTVPFFSSLYARHSYVVALLYQFTGEIFLKQFVRPVGYFLYALERHSYIPWCLNRANHVITLSNSNKTELIEVCSGLAPEKVSVIPPGADHDNFRPGQKSHEPLLLFLNRFVRYKQPEHLIVGMKEVCAHVANAKLMMVGTSANGKYATDLHRLAKVLGIAEKVSFFLSKPFAASKVALLQRAWVHVLPSVKEGFGLSVLEAAACGTPTVGYDVAGIRDAVIQGQTGMLAKTGDTSSLASNLIDILTDEKKLRSLGEGAVRWAAKFPWDYAATQFIGVMKNN